MSFFFKRPTAFRGYVDAIDRDRVVGWAWDHSRRGKRLRLQVHSAGALIGSVRADRYRKDLLDSGIGDGRYGFEFELPNRDLARETVAVKVAGSNFWLTNNAARGEASELADTTNAGLPLLRPTLSVHTIDDRDVAIAAELQRLWQGVWPAKTASEFPGRETMWGDIVASRHQPLVALLNGSDPSALAVQLVALHRTPASEGLAQGERAYWDFSFASASGRRAAVAPFHRMLAALAQAIGIERVECEEQNFAGEALARPSEDLVARVERHLGHAIVPPAIFDGLFGLEIGDRVLHGRDVQALYAAIHAMDASGRPQPRICEIGGGLGQVAYYAWLRGVRHYTIVDLPSVCAMQYFYLRRALPNVSVRLGHPAGSQAQQEGIDLLFATHLNSSPPISADIVLNCDSFPEMGDAVCARYFSQIPRWAPLLLSINQEANQEYGGRSERQTVVGQLLPNYGFRRLYRFRHWIRKGYVEELWQSPADTRLGPADASGVIRDP